MKAIVHLFAGSALSIQAILMCCECCMFLRVPKYREGKGKVFTGVIHVQQKHIQQFPFVGLGKILAIGL